MSFLDINGLAVSVELPDGYGRDSTDVQNFARSEGLSFEGALYATKREWSISVPWDSVEANSIALNGWIRGRGHYYTFERKDGATTRFQRYSTDGGPGFDTQLTNHATSKFGTWCGLLVSGASSTVTVTFGNEGTYTVTGWKANTSSYALSSLVYDGSTTRYFNGSTVAASTAFAILTAASGYLAVTVEGKNTTSGAMATASFDGFMIAPYAMTTAQLAARNARTVAEPAFPFVELDGDCLEDLQPVTVKGFVAKESMQQITRGGTVNSRQLDLLFVER